MPHLLASDLVDAGIDLPEAASRSFWLHGSVWQFPGFDNADTFVDRLVREELVVRDPIVEAVLQNQPQALSARSIRAPFCAGHRVGTGLHPADRARPLRDDAPSARVRRSPTRSIGRAMPIRRT